MFDLRERITVFLITTGGPTMDQALAALEAQEMCRFQLKVIRNVAPMSAAFQQMNERCKTPLFVQVDEDMILYPEAIWKLYSSMQASPENTAIYFLSLLDRDLGEPIVGVKIYRHAATMETPWQDSFSCEMDQIDRLKAAGYRIDGKFRPMMGSHVVGEHLPGTDPGALFERYERLAQKLRLIPGNEGWAKWPMRFLDRATRNPTRAHWFALMGWISGVSQDPEEQVERDYTRGNQRLDRLARYFGGLPDGHAPVMGKPPTVPGVPVKTRSNILSATAQSFGPTELIGYITSECNLACSWCRRQQGERPDAPDLTVPMLRSALDRWPSIKSVCLAGFGEPLLSPETVPLIWECLADGRYTSLITNGIMIKEAPVETIDALASLNQITISLNAANAGDYLATTGIDGFDLVIDGVKRLLERGIKPILSFVCTYPSLPKIEGYLDLAQIWGCQVDLVSVLPHCGEVPPTEEYWRIALCDRVAEVGAFLEEAKGHPWAGKVRSWPVLLGKDPGRCPWTCDSPSVSIGIDGAGRLSPCRRILPPSESFGAVGDMDAWSGGAFAIWRAGMTDRSNEICKFCFGNWKP